MRVPPELSSNPDPATGSSDSTTATFRSRPPGGKALLRLVHYLRARGFGEAAESLIRSAVSENRQGEARRRSGISAAGGPAQSAPAAGSPPPAAPPAAPAGAPLWTSIGPVTIPGGQTYGVNTVNVSGRVSAVAVDSRNPSHVLCGAAAGGVWESSDRGMTWAPRTDNAPSLAVGAIAFDPQNSQIVYCGTGEGNFYYVLGAGILKSMDGGTTWALICSDPFVYQGFYDLKIDPANGQHLLSANTYGLYQSTDGGVTWTQPRNAKTWSISFAPNGANQVLAASSDGVYQSANGGATWNLVALPGAPATFTRASVAHAPATPGMAYVFAAGDPSIPIPGDGNPKHTMPTAYLWRRAAAGAAFTAMALPPNLNTTQAWYDWFLAAAPDNASQIYFGAIDAWRGDLAGGAFNWTNLTTKLPAGDSIHPDQHAIAFEPGNPNTIYIGCDGGLFRSPDRGISWNDCNNGLVITEFEYIAQNQADANWLLGGTQDNGTQRYSGNPPAWDHVMDGDGGDCSVNQTTPATCFAEFYGISPMISIDSGTTWNPLAPPTVSGETSLFYCPFTASSGGGDTLALGTVTIYVSRDNGTTWSGMPLPAPAANASALYVPNIDNVYVGTDDGRVFSVNWTGAGWSGLTPRPSN